MGWLNRQHNCTSNNRINNKLWASTKSSEYNSCHKFGWPAAIVGIVSSAALLAERKWGVTLTLVSLSMVISGMGPYSVVRLITLKDIYGVGGFTLITTLLSTLALLYWCNPKHRRSIRL